MVENPTEQNDIKLADCTGADVGEVNNLFFDVESQQFLGKIKTSLVPPTSIRPGKMIGGENTAGAAPFCLKAVESVLGANV